MAKPKNSSEKKAIEDPDIVKELVSGMGSRDLEELLNAVAPVTSVEEAPEITPSGMTAAQAERQRKRAAAGGASTARKRNEARLERIARSQGIPSLRVQRENVVKTKNEIERRAGTPLSEDTSELPELGEVPEMPRYPESVERFSLERRQQRKNRKLREVDMLIKPYHPTNRRGPNAKRVTSWQERPQQPTGGYTGAMSPLPNRVMDLTGIGGAPLPEGHSAFLEETDETLPSGRRGYRYTVSVGDQTVSGIVGSGARARIAAESTMNVLTTGYPAFRGINQDIPRPTPKPSSSMPQPATGFDTDVIRPYEPSTGNIPNKETGTTWRQMRTGRGTIGSAVAPSSSYQEGMDPFKLRQSALYDIEGQPPPSGTSASIHEMIDSDTGNTTYGWLAQHGGQEHAGVAKTPLRARIMAEGTINRMSGPVGDPTMPLSKQFRISNG